jgi:hypothetical protein
LTYETGEGVCDDAEKHGTACDLRYLFQLDKHLMPPSQF